MPWQTTQIMLTLKTPMAWQPYYDFYHNHLVPNQETITDHSYLRSFRWQQSIGYWRIERQKKSTELALSLTSNHRGDLAPIIDRIRQMLDLDAPTTQIETQLRTYFTDLPLIKGLRLPGFWSPFEAAIRAIIGQQISIKAAHQQIYRLIDHLGEPLADTHLTLFPTPISIAKSQLSFLGMPASRRQTLRAFAHFYLVNPLISHQPQQWQTIKGIGPWTINYAKLRGLADRDVWPTNDLGIIKALKLFNISFNPQNARPWRSYLCQQIWSQPSLLANSLPAQPSK